MSVDKLQNQIRKLKNPSMVSFSLAKSQIPPAFLESNDSVPLAYGAYAKAVLTALKGEVPAVRFGFGSFAVAGVAGIETLKSLLSFAKEAGFYVLLDSPEIYAPHDAVCIADAIFDAFAFDGLVLNCYIGSDMIKPFAEQLKRNDKDLFVALRTANKSASEMQDLLTGTRLVYMAAGDMTKRLGKEFVGKGGYSRIGGIGPATSADSLRTLRAKYPSMFLLIDGFDYSGANAKNCSFAFDRLGHGAIACAGSSIIGAWQDEDADALSLVTQAAERMKKNLLRYVNIL